MSTSDFDTYRDPERPRRGRARRRSRERAGQTDRGSWLTGRGTGRGEQALVPDVEFTSYYGRPIIKAVPWTKSIPAYLFTGGLAAGSELLATGAHLSGNDTLRRSTRLTAALAVALSGALLVEDLGKPDRFLNMMRTVKLTSPMSIGTWILTGFSAGAIPTALAEVSGLAPVPLGGLIRRVETPAQLVGGFFSPPLAAYTAVLLSGTVTPLWHEAWAELPFVFVGSASAASGGMAMALTPVGAAGPARAYAVLGAATDLVAVRRMEHGLGMVSEPLRQGWAGQLSRAATALNLTGLAGTLLVGRSRAGAVLSGLALVGASVATRFAIFEAGLETARDPKYTVLPQRERLATRQGRDSITTGPNAGPTTGPLTPR